MSAINNVKVYRRTLLQDNRGWFLKVITGNEDMICNDIVGEIYVTYGNVDTYKGGHYHDVANEWFTLIKGSAILQLEDIITHEKHSYSLSMSNPLTIFVPAKVAHTFFSTNNSDFCILAYTDKKYDPTDTVTFWGMCNK